LPGGGQDRVSRPPGRVRAALCGRLGGPRGHHPPGGWLVKVDGADDARRRVLPGGFASYALCIGGYLAEKT
jgi:hypothetical protein